MIDQVRGAGGEPRVGSRSGVELETFPASIAPCANLAVKGLLDCGDGEFSDVDLFAGGPQLEHQRLNSNGGALGGLVCDEGDCGQQLDVYGRAPSIVLVPAPMVKLDQNVWTRKVLILMMSDMQMSVVEAKAHLSELIEAALAGDEVEITRHGKAVVKLEPIKSKGRKLGFFPIGIDPDQALAPLGEDFYEWMS